MSNDFEARLRAMARELSESVERAAQEIDVDGIAGWIGVDAERARDWVHEAGAWLRTQTEHLGEEPGDDEPSPAWAEPAPPTADRADRADRAEPPPAPAANSEPAAWPSAAPHPLDLPSDEQGLALAALDSGRWAVEPGTEALASAAQGPGPSDALGLVRELRVRDWISREGELTVTGRHALARWLETRH